MKNLQYPIKFSFKITTLSNDFTAQNASGHTIAYVKQKMFKLKEAITVYSDENKTQVLFTISANQWLDFSASYSIFDSNNKEVGKIARKGWRSMWKAEYDIVDQNSQPQYKVQEANAWVRIADSVVGGIPIVSAFTGYLFNPTYKVTDTAGQVVVKLKKMPSLFGKEFQLTKVADIDQEDNERVVLGLMMMILLERRRG
jgi:uncharacterized protein YxjI